MNKNSSFIYLSAIARRAEEDHLSSLKRKTNSRFTLIELLIVVAIIAILASLLLPALRSALNKSKAITCLSGMKQLGLASQNYLDQHNDTIFVMTSDWAHIYFLGTNSGYMNLSQIGRDATGITDRICEKDIGVIPWVPQKNICSALTSPIEKLRANTTSEASVSTCGSSSSCSGHRSYFQFYGILMGTGSYTFPVSSGNLYHKTGRLRQPSGSLFWSEGYNQIQKSHLGTIPSDLSKSGFWQHANRTNILFFDGHAGSVGTKQTVCEHTPSETTIKTCASCRFWAPYIK